MSAYNLSTKKWPMLELWHIKMQKELGPVVQSIVSLTSSFRGQLVKCFMTL